MRVANITVNDLSNPTEVNAWFFANPTITLHSVVIEDATFYIFYE